jgi:hypothetical protein
MPSYKQIKRIKISAYLLFLIAAISLSSIPTQAGWLKDLFSHNSKEEHGAHNEAIISQPVVKVPNKKLSRYNNFPPGVFGNPYQNSRWADDFSQFVSEQILDTQFRSLFYNANGAATSICSKYSFLTVPEKISVWVSFFKGLAKAESGYNYNSRPKTGIFQLTCDQNAKKGYGCSCSSNYDLKINPFKSIDCAMRIVNFWVAKGTFIYDGNHPYFESMRRRAAGGAHLKKIIGEINSTSASFCTGSKSSGRKKN